MRKHLLNYVPDVFKFGTNGENTNALIFTYSGKDEQIWFNLDKKGIDFYLGLSIGYNLNIFYDDPQLWKNIASSNNFNKEVFETTKTVALIVKVNFKFWYYNFWKSILQNVLMRSYDINSRFYISDYSTKIADYSNYNENYYYTNLSFVNNANQVNVSEIKTLFDLSKTGNFKDQVSTIKNDKVQNPNTLNWGNKATEEVKGITPLTSESNLKTIKEKMFSLTTNNSSFILTKYNLDYSFNTLFNFLAKIEFQVKASVGNVDVHPIISFNISMFKSNLYFPVNFYDETNKKLITNFEKTYSDISFNAQL
nr:hypothetical protein [Malacoplasma penetrans]